MPNKDNFLTGEGKIFERSCR